MESKLEIIQKIKYLNNQPCAVQAIWDGNAQGWLLKIEAIIEQGKHCDAIKIADLQDKEGDLRLVNKIVPSWPEADFSIDLGQDIERELLIPFYFPSSDKPNNDCPNWCEKSQASKCEGCKKLISSELENLCYSCLLKRKLVNSKNENRGLYLLLETKKESKNRCNFYSFTCESMRLVLKKLQQFYKAQSFVNNLNENINYTLKKSDLDFFIKVTECLLKNLLSKYEDKRKFRRGLQIEEITFLGNKTKVETRFNKTGCNIKSLSSLMEILNLASYENLDLQIIGNGSISKQDLKFLRYLKKNAKNQLIKLNLLQHIRFRKALNRLKASGCIKELNGELIITTKGQVVNIAAYN